MSNTTVSSTTINSQKISTKKSKSKVKRESILRPSIYQNIQKKRKSQLIDCTQCTDTNTAQPSSYPFTPNKRIVFISLRGLYNCWRNVPNRVIFDAILVLPLYRDWILCPHKYVGWKRDFMDIISDEKFLTLLQWKDRQGLVFYMLDATDIDDEYDDDDESNIASFWYHFSCKLQSLYDPITGDSYKPLLLNERWWKYKYCNEYKSKYNVSPRNILHELRRLTMKFRNIQEILYQSNPSLNVIVTYYETPELMGVKSILNTKTDDAKGIIVFKCCSDVTLHGNQTVDESKPNIWWISTEYSPDEKDDSESLMT